MALKLHSVRLVVVFIWHMISHEFRSCSRHPPITNSTDATKIMAKVYNNQNLIVDYFTLCFTTGISKYYLISEFQPMKLSRYYVLFDIRLNLNHRPLGASDWWRWYMLNGFFPRTAKPWNHSNALFQSLLLGAIDYLL